MPRTIALKRATAKLIMSKVIVNWHNVPLKACTHGNCQSINSIRPRSATAQSHSRWSNPIEHRVSVCNHTRAPKTSSSVPYSIRVNCQACGEVYEGEGLPRLQYPGSSPSGNCVQMNK